MCTDRRGIGSTNRPNDGRRLAGLANCDGQDVPLGPCHRFGPDGRKPHVTLVRFKHFDFAMRPRHAESLTPGRQYEASSLNERLPCLGDRTPEQARSQGRCPEISSVWVTPASNQVPAIWPWSLMPVARVAEAPGTAKVVTRPRGSLTKERMGGS